MSTTIIGYLSLNREYSKMMLRQTSTGLRLKHNFLLVMHEHEFTMLDMPLQRNIVRKMVCEDIHSQDKSIGFKLVTSAR